MNTYGRYAEDIGTSHRTFELLSPALVAPSNSYIVRAIQESLESPNEEEHKELNPYRLVMSLRKLQKSPKYQDQASDVVVEHSIDGSCRVYVQRPSQPVAQTTPSCTQSPGNRDGRWTPVSTQTFLEKLRELAEARKNERSEGGSARLEIALDNCTVIYYPEDSELPEGDLERVEVLPCSQETPSDGRPRYNFSSRSTLRFITNALSNRSPKRTPTEAPSEGEMSTSDSSVLFIQHPEATARGESSEQSTPVTSLRDEDSQVHRPCSAQQLKEKLEELKIPGEETAIDGNITMIINKPSESSTPSGLSSADLQTPMSRSLQREVNLMSPRTSWKLMRKLQDAQEVCDGEEVKIAGGTRIFLTDSEGTSRLRSHRSSMGSPDQTRRFSPQHEVIVERLFDLRRQLQREEDSSSEEESE